MCPRWRIRARPEPGEDAPLLSEGWVNSFGGMMASSTYYSSMKQSVTLPFLRTAAGKAQASKAGTSAVPAMTGLSVEFVAKPREAQQVEAASPAAIGGGFREVTGFAGCL